MRLIGEIRVSTTPFYDTTQKRNSFKKRPVLIIGKADSRDYNVLPVSRVTNRLHLDTDYDISLTKADYPLLNLSCDSFVRVHKQTTVNKNSITSQIGDMKNSYPTLFGTVMDKLKEYNDKLYDNAIK